MGKESSEKKGAAIVTKYWELLKIQNPKIL